MVTIPIQLPDDIADALSSPGMEQAALIRLSAALQLAHDGRLSCGKAAEMAGISRVEFFEELLRRGLGPSGAQADELARDLADA